MLVQWQYSEVGWSSGFVIYVIVLILGISFNYLFKCPFFKNLDKCLFLDIIL